MTHINRILHWLLFVTLWCAVVSHAMEKTAETSLVQPEPKECNFTRRQLTDDEIPSGYNHCPIQKQLSYYREEVYNPVFESNGKKISILQKGVIPKLFPILENAFALINDYITKDLSMDLEEKAAYLNHLKDLWKLAQNNESRLTSSLFQGFNRNLAYIIDCYKDHKPIDLKEMKEENPAAYPNFMRDNPNLENPNRDDIIFIVYGNPDRSVKNRNILPYHFVNQYCYRDYSGHIAFFDIFSTQPQKGTKKDPHWSKENGTLKLLKHDIGHYNYLSEFYVDEEEIEFVKDTCDIANRYKKKMKINEFTVLVNGLFIMLHEKPEITEELEPGRSYRDTAQQFVQLMKDQMIFAPFAYNTLGFYGSEDYKVERRDWEYILKATYPDPIDNSRTIVHDGQGKPFLPITWNSAEQRVSSLFKKSPTRQEDMQKVLRDGYVRYWDYFLSLTECKNCIK